MKKIIALLLSLIMVCSLATVAFADETETPAELTDVSTVTITKTYKATNGGVSPAETFGFSAFTPGETVGENPAATYPTTLPTITAITYAEGEATADGTGTGTKTATITLPTYTAVGVYTYSFNEVTPATKTAGVTYNPETLHLVVTVVEQNGKVRVAAVHCEGDGETKTDEFVNSYESGTLAVTKTVTGNLGDKSKYFDVTVTFTAASGEAINSTITYTGGQYATAVTVENNTATIQVKDGDTVTFANVPEGVTWTVAEADYTGEGYDEAKYSAATGVMTAGATASSQITNNKDVEVDTGIALDSAPYFLMLAVAVIGMVALVSKKRYEV